MRKLHLFSATSLDGFIAGPDGDLSWLFTDQDYGYTPFFAQIDTVLTGRLSYEACLSMMSTDPFPGRQVFVFTRTPDVHAAGSSAAVQWTNEDPASLVRRLKSQPGRDLWVVGGASIASGLLQAGLIDEMVVSIHPIVLGTGIPLFAPATRPVGLQFERVMSHESGLVQIFYRSLPAPRDAAEGRTSGQ
jgi:dihydrofolate reductase